jgi:FtsZ-binding cell division protein ZapB
MSEPNATADGLEQLQDLEEKILQTIDLLKSTRAEKEELLRENARLQQECAQHREGKQKLEERLGRLEKERETVRGRLQRLLEQVDALTRERPRE